MVVWFTRESVEADPDTIYLFGDNIKDAQRGFVPAWTQAQIRGLPNAIGIPTKKNRGTSKESYFYDEDFECFKTLLDEALELALASGKSIAIPTKGIGTGKAMLKEKAPKCFAYLEERIDWLMDQVI